jgi:hypothetical protein
MPALPCQERDESQLMDPRNAKRIQQVLSMNFEPKEQPAAPRQSPAPSAHQQAKQDAYQPQDDEDDIPF